MVFSTLFLRVAKRLQHTIFRYSFLWPNLSPCVRSSCFFPYLFAVFFLLSFRVSSLAFVSFRLFSRLFFLSPVSGLLFLLLSSSRRVSLLVIGLSLLSFCFPTSVCVLMALLCVHSSYYLCDLLSECFASGAALFGLSRVSGRILPLCSFCCRCRLCCPIGFGVGVSPLQWLLLCRLWGFCSGLGPWSSLV